MGRRNRKGGEDQDNGFAEWGGYMEAKKAKLTAQFSESSNKKSNLFRNVAIMVNGYTRPSAEELKQIMSEHGGVYQLYPNQGTATTHIIALNLPNVKIRNLGNIPVVNPNWITESVSMAKLLDYSKYLLYTKHTRSQPKLNFDIIDDTLDEVVDKSTAGSCVEESSNCNNSSNVAAVHNKKTITASDPKFLSEFYNNSRLHLISTLGAEYKQMVNNWREETGKSFPGRTKLLKKYSEANFNCEYECIIMHIDMDCFFVSVGLRNRPELRGKPVAVTHARGNPSTRSEVDRQAELDLYMKRLPKGAVPRLENIDNNCSLSEIASCSYEARKCGVKNGMFLGTAQKLCPDLIPIPYDFQGYKEVSSVLYKKIAEYTLDIEAVSCDEMYVDVTNILKETRMSVYEWAGHIRNEIRTETGCPCSTGFGRNRLQARLATKNAKPDGHFYLEPADVETYLYDLPLGDLPGVGYSTLAKLRNLGLQTCGDVQNASINLLRAELGHKNGETLYDQAKGIDQKPLSYEHERKSVSAEVNYGIRFVSNEEAFTFMESLSNEVHSRLASIKMKAKCITLKLMIRAAEAPKETAKFLGHGVCDSLSRSISTNYPIDDPKLIFKETKLLYTRLNVKPEDVRGVGIQLSRLEKCAGVNPVLSAFLNRKSHRGDKKSSVEQSNYSNDQNGLKNLGELDGHDVSKDLKASNFQNCIKEETNQILDVSKGAVHKHLLSKTSVESKTSKNRSNSSNSTSVITKNATNVFSRVGTKIDSTNVSNTMTTHQDRIQGVTSICEKVDFGVLKELPDEIRNEIIKEYGLQVSKIEEVLNVNQQNEEVTPSVQNKGFADLDYEDLKSLLRNWIKNEINPKEVDVDMLSDYFRSLALDRKLGRLHPLLNLIHRNITKKNCCSWHEAYMKIVNCVQEGMVIRYGSALSVNRKFDCHRH